MLKNNKQAIEIPCHLYNNPRSGDPMIASIEGSKIICEASEELKGVLRKDDPNVKETQKILTKSILPDFCDGSFCKAAIVLKTKASSIRQKALSQIS